MTVGDLFQTAWEEHWNTARFKRSRWAKEVWKYWKKHLEPTFGKTPVEKLTAGDVRKFHRRLESTPFTANRCLEVLSRLFSFAQEYEIYSGPNPCKLVRAFPEESRSRYASVKELQRLNSVIERLEPFNPIESVFVKLLLLTGCRPIDLERAKRGQLVRVEGGAGLLIFHGKSTSKTGDAETVVFSPAAMQLVEKLPTRADGLLIGKVKYRWYWDIVRREADVPDLWLRDLRRTFGTYALSHGVSLGAVGELLNHRSTQTTKKYAKLLPDARIRAVNVVAGKILKGA